MLQQDSPDDDVIATGEDHSVREFAELALAIAGLDWRHYVEVDPLQFRPVGVACLRGDASKAHWILGSRPQVTLE